MNKENKCALCSHRSIHNGICLVDNKGCKFKPNGYCKIFSEELEKIRKEIEKDQEQMANEKDFGRYYGMGWSIRIIDNHISELKGE